MRWKKIFRTYWFQRQKEWLTRKPHLLVYPRNAGADWSKALHSGHPPRRQSKETGSQVNQPRLKPSLNDTGCLHSKQQFNQLCHISRPGRKFPILQVQTVKTLLGTPSSYIRVPGFEPLVPRVSSFLLTCTLNGSQWVEYLSLASSNRSTRNVQLPDLTKVRPRPSHCMHLGDEAADRKKLHVHLLADDQSNIDIPKYKISLKKFF